MGTIMWDMPVVEESQERLDKAKVATAGVGRIVAQAKLLATTCT